MSHDQQTLVRPPPPMAGETTVRATLGLDPEAGDTHRLAGRNRLWDQTHELLLVLDERARIVDANPAWPSALGWPIDALIGQSFDTFVHPVDCALLPTPWRVRTAADRMPSRFERRLRQADGGYRTISWIMFCDDALIYATGRDVDADRTAAVAYETTLAQLQQSQKMQAVGQLTGGLAHDFNNLLAPITHSLELIQRQVGRGEHDRVDQHAGVALAAARRAAALARRLLISITDTGAGIPSDIVDHVFEPFFTTKPVGSGSGLGLAMVHGFVRQSGGHVTVESRVGYGTTFTLYLPRCDHG